jgi:hypothetical protein
MRIKIVFKDKSFIKGEVDNLTDLVVRSNNFTYLNINKQEILYIKVFNEQKDFIDYIIENQDKYKDILDPIEDESKDILDPIEDESKDILDPIEDESKDILDPIHEDAKKEAEAAIKRMEEVKLEIKDNLFSSIEDQEKIIDPKANYGLPSFSALKISKQYSDQKARNKNTRNKE